MTSTDKIIFLILACAIIVLLILPGGSANQYRCEISEISPDLSIESREHCRQERRTAK